MVQAHPWFARVSVNAPPMGPYSLMWFDRALGTLSGVDLPEAEKLGLVMGLVTYVQGAYRLRVELAAGYADNPTAFGRDYAAGLHRVVDVQRMPWLGRLVRDGVFDAPEEDPTGQGEFEFGLSVYLDGVAARIEQVNR